MSNTNKIFNDNDYVNQAELARSLVPTVSKPYISKLVKNGILVLNENKKIKLGDAKKAIHDNSDPQRAYKKKENLIKELEKDLPLTEEDKENILNLDFGNFLKEIEKLSFNDTKTKSEQMGLIIQKIKIEKDLGNLVPMEGVKHNAFELSKKLKDSLLAIPDRVCDIVASETDARKVHNLLTHEIKQTLEDIINELSKKL